MSDPKRILFLILLFLGVSRLFGSVDNVNGASSSTCYTSTVNILNGTQVSGSFPASVQEVDQEYLTIQSVISEKTASTYPSQYVVHGSTSWVSGAISDLASDDSEHMTFRSYARKGVAQFAENNTSDVDSSPDKGTHSNFSAQQAGPDGVYDTLTEENTEFFSNKTRYLTINQHMVNGLTAYDFNTAQTSSYLENSTSRLGTHSCTWGIRVWKRSSNGTEVEITSGSKVATVSRASDEEGEQSNTWGCPQLSLSFEDAIVVRVYASLDAADILLRTFVSDQLGAFQLASSVWKVYYWTGRNSSEFLTAADFRFGDSVHNSRIENLSYRGMSYQLDLEVQWADVEYYRSNKLLCIQSAATESENVAVDFWNGTGWEELVTDLSVGWNNISVASYLTSAIFTIRFTGGSETGDVAQERWDIDATLLLLWSEAQILEVEFTGSSNTGDWIQLDWTINSAWTIGSVNVTLQLYNFTLGDYSTSGNGHISYTSADTSNTDEPKSQRIDSSLNHFRNGTGHWKIKITGVRAPDTQFELETNRVEFKYCFREHVISTEFLFSEVTTNTPNQLNITLISQCDITNVNVTIQLWNYSSSVYAAKGEACLKYFSNGENISKTLSINADPQFYISDGNAKIKITSVSTATQHQQEINQIKLVLAFFTPPFDWVRTGLYALLVVFVVIFLLALKFKLESKNQPMIEDEKDSFSKSFKMTHHQIIGKKILLEVDPTTNYQNALSDFVSEGQNNHEMMYVFTSSNNPLYSEFSETNNIKFFLLTSKTSSPRQLSQNETLLPASDLSVVLNAFVGIQKVETEKPINIVFDSLSDAILLCGFEKTYKFLRWLLEGISSPKTTTLFIFNPTAHETMTSASVRGLFQTRFAYTKNGAKVGTL